MFALTIQTDNAAFDPDPAPEVARLLRQAVHTVEAGDDGGTLRDENGNTVGGWSYDGEATVPVLALRPVRELVEAAILLLHDDDPARPGEQQYTTDGLSEAEAALRAALAALPVEVSA